MMMTKTGFMPDPYCESGLPKLTKEKRYLVEMMKVMMMRRRRKMVIDIMRMMRRWKMVIDII